MLFTTGLSIIKTAFHYRFGLFLPIGKEFARKSAVSYVTGHHIVLLRVHASRRYSAKRHRIRLRQYEDLGHGTVSSTFLQSFRVQGFAVYCFSIMI